MYLTPPSAVVNAQRGTVAGSTWLLIALAFLAPFVIYFDTARSFVDTWNSSETFAHGYVILPISLWLVWRRRANFALLPPTPYFPALVLLAGAGAAWLLARMAEVQVVQQYALAAMIPIIALAVLGTRLAKSLAFPLLFVLFAVPFGEIFIGPLIEFTADFTVWAVQATGIPVLRNGTRFEHPTGNWSVVEACSGVRYLISSITLGSLYAYLTYRSTGRRLLFVAFSVVVPIIANGLRAYMIVMIGHTSGMELATGVDHLVYGWVFFGLVMFLMFWIGSYWRQDVDEPAVPAAVAASAQAPGTATRLVPAVVAVLALLALWPAYGAWNARATFNPAPVQLALPALALPAAPAFNSWEPHYMAADANVGGTWRSEAGTPVGLDVLYYRNQDGSKKLISSINRMAGEKSPYHEVSAAGRMEDIGGRSLPVRESLMRGPEGSFLVWHWMWIGERAVTSQYVGKLVQAKEKLLFRGDDGAVLMVSAPYGASPDEARAALRAFLRASLPALEAELGRAKGN
jgi:exosortase A